MQSRTLAKRLIMAFVCMTALVGLLVFRPNITASAENVQLSPQQTLALYGTSIEGEYWTGNAYQPCTFHYCASLAPKTADISDNYIQFNSKSAVADITYTYMQQRDWLLYVCPSRIGSPGDGSMVGYSPGSYYNLPNRFTIRLSPSIDISNLEYYREIVSFSSVTGGDVIYDSDYSFASVEASYSNTPLTFHPQNAYWYGNTIEGYAKSTIKTSWYQIQDQTVQPSSVQMNVFDILLSDYDETAHEYNLFSIGEQTISSRIIGEIHVTYGDNQDYYYYAFLVSCPYLSDGYKLPDEPTTPPDYSDRLESIDISINTGNSHLRQILDKLDAIYNRMAQNGLPNPTLASASTIPRDLQQYYSGVASGAPSASAINDFAGGAEIIPFSSILSASGLGGLFGVLVAVACAGWVLTRGRGG